MKKISVQTTNLFFLIFVLAYIGLSMLTGILLSGVDLPYWSLFIISDAVLLLPIIIFLGICRANPLEMECMRATGISNILLSVVYAYALLPLILFLNMITMTFTDNAADDMLAGVSEYSLGIRLLLLAAAPAVVEEFVFRGVLREPYRRRNVLGAALVSGLFFGIIHLNVNQFVYAFAMGVAFSLLAEASGSILCPMAAHFAVNAYSVLLSFAALQEEGMDEYLEQAENTSRLIQDTGVPLVLYAVVLAFVAGGIGIAVVVLRAIAKKEKRLEYMTEVFRGGLSVRDAETTPFIDVYFLGAAAIGAVFMILNL